VSAVVISAAPPFVEHSEGVWHAAWRRFKGDRVGMVCLVIVLAFLVLIALGLGLVASNGSAGRGAECRRPC
jgi:peptide/nickel transport system permease protein